eukprot:Protomagalhaensia_sp_Gyna_25__2036@NODE_2096_length_1294_cov_900_244622_g1733_i0_p1_GENE_NODE_2096_length_1294_cov_900_244622_g1733_i0NODE_2096_length_1294_cov_900_244622_g1733_i0_p1_ORF_typecomplete_len258_score64_14Ribosomal_S6e/PF01092_19/4_8e48Caudo_TAP/PF02413_17/0_09Caudo_TAP/PF02413_17/5_1e03Adenine_glyco/PF03352_13/1_4_NODE_2096_length_1294_cov_900_244622_g1733_i04101183
MKLLVSDPENNNTKLFEVDDEKRLIPFYDKRIGAEVPGDTIAPEFAGYILKVTGGNDKQGFPMMQGVLVSHRVRLLFREGMPCYRPRRDGAMKRKSVRGCIVAPDISALNLVIVKRGDTQIEGLTDQTRPRRLGPKRANKIRKMFGLAKHEDPRPYVVRRVIKEGKKVKAPKIQRLVTPTRLRRKRVRLERAAENKKASLAALKEYRTVLSQYRRLVNTEKKAARDAERTAQEHQAAKRQAKKEKVRREIEADAAQH